MHPRRVNVLIATGDTETQAHGQTEEMKGKTKKQVGQIEGFFKTLEKDITAMIHRATK